MTHNLCFINLFLAPAPDESLIVHNWSIFHARAFDDRESAHEHGFRGDSELMFRWVEREPLYEGDRDVSRLVPTNCLLLFGPPVRWDSQPEGICDNLVDNIAVVDLIFIFRNELDLKLRLDRHSRYGEGFRRAVVRGVCHTQDGLPLFLLVLREQDPSLTCCRRVQGQITCPELSCVMCHLEHLNLTSVPVHYGLGGAMTLVALNLPMHDRHRILSREHGVIRPRDVDWEALAGNEIGKPSISLKFLVR